MSLAKAVASKGNLFRSSLLEAAAKGGSKLRLVSSGFALSALEGKPLSTRAAVRGVRLSRGNLNGLCKARTATFPRREQQMRSLGLFADGGSGISHRMLKELERKAARAPSDPNAEAQFFIPLAEKYPEQAMSRFDSGQFPVNAAMKEAYLKSAAVVGRMNQIDMQAVMARPEGSGHHTAPAAGLGGTDPRHFGGVGQKRAPGTSGEPLHVTVSDIGWKNNMFKLLRFVVGAFFIATVVSSFLDLSLGSKLMPASSVHMAEASDKTFEDVVGIDEAKSELEEIVMYLKNPTVFTRLGGKLPSGLMLTGPPGTGKTLLARAIAGEAGVPFYYSSGSEFEEMFVGVGAKRVRDLFTAAKKTSPCIIFIDEIDAIGASRQLRESSAMKMTLNQLLVEMDGFEQNSGIIVIAATNFPETLDHALTRPGRFDKHVAVPLPDVRGREKILMLYTSRTILDAKANLKALAQGTPGFSGADLYNLVNQAAVKASLDGAKAVTTEALEWAKDKILMGAERRSAVINEETAKCTAFHEGGHAIVALMTPGAHPVHKATIMPRGAALGMVMQLPEGDQTSMSKKQMLAKMDVCMGGRVAEEMVFGPENVTSGATSDLQQATNIARSMVTHCGMSEKVGKVFVKDQKEEGDVMRAAIDSEVRELLDQSYKRAWNCLETHRRDLDLVANALLKYETLTGAEIMEVLAGRPVKNDPDGTTHVAPATASASKRPVSAATAAMKNAASKAASGATARGGPNTQAKR